MMRIARRWLAFVMALSALTAIAWFASNAIGDPRSDARSAVFRPFSDNLVGFYGGYRNFPGAEPGAHSSLCGGRPVMRWTFATMARWRFNQLRADLPSFLLSECLIVAAFFVTAFGLGRVVRASALHVNYARKILGATMLATPFALNAWLPYAPNPLAMGLSFLIFVVCLAAFAEPVRRRLPLLDIAFAAIDRPEDRPHTLTWFVTAFVVSSALLMAMMWWAVPAFPAYVGIALAGVAIGDLLAGAVGTRYGAWKYSTRALFTDKTYTRSLQGSACVYLTTLTAVVVFGADLPQGQYIAALILMPIALTLAEAKSPHTWDEPGMFLVAMIVAMAIVKAWQLASC